LENTDGYKIYWGTEQGTYPNNEDVGDVLQAEVAIPYKSYIVVTAYNEEGESGYSESILYGDHMTIHGILIISNGNLEIKK
jgi:hypothetical protein